VDQIVVSLYAKRLSTGEISAHFAEIYGASVSRETVSRITDKVVEEMTGWQNRPLDEIRARGEGRNVMSAPRDPIMIPSGPFRPLSDARSQGQRNGIHAGQRRRTGIEPADDAERRPPVLKSAPGRLRG
jgi:hypothetical protein